MGNKSKRRQASVFIRDEDGYVKGTEHKDIGYGRRKKNRRSHGGNMKTATDPERERLLRREWFRERKRITSL